MALSGSSQYDTVAFLVFIYADYLEQALLFKFIDYAVLLGRFYSPGVEN